MEGYEVINDKGERAWWDGQRITPIPKQDSPAQLTADMQKFDAEKIQPEQQRQQKEFARLSDESLLKQAGQAAGKEAQGFNTSMIQNVGVPLAQAGLGLATGGMSIPAQMLISGGGELAAQSSGLAPESKSNLALATLLPGVGKAIQRGGRIAGQAMGKMTHTPQQVSEIGGEAMAKTLGAEPDIIKRSLQAPKSEALYELARSKGGVSTATLKTHIDEALTEQMGMSSRDIPTVKRLSNLSRKLAINPELDANDVINELQTLGQAGQQALARSHTVTGTALGKATRGAKGAAGLTKEADTTFAREQDVKSILEAGRSSNAAAAIDKFIAERGKGMTLTENELREIKEIAHRIGRVSTTEGVFGKGVEFVQGSLAQMLGDRTGRAMLRKVLGPEGKTSPAAISAGLQFWRAYEAQKGKGD